MKKLTADDLALLASRGKVTNGFHTSIEFDIPSYDKPKKAKKAKANNHPLVGKILHHSWGYNMTINEYCKIVSVSPSGKTVLCRMVNKIDVDKGASSFAGKVRAGHLTNGPEFRLHVRDGYNDQPSFVGQFPYICGKAKNDSSFTKGYFSIDNGGHAFENHMD